MIGDYFLTEMDTTCPKQHGRKDLLEEFFGNEIDVKTFLTRSINTYELLGLQLGLLFTIFSVSLHCPN